MPGLVEMGRKQIRIAYFSLPENYNYSRERSSPHRMNPETAAPLEGYLRARFPGFEIKFIHVDSSYVNPADFLRQQFDIVGINTHWRGISPAVSAMSNWPLDQMAQHVFFEGSFVNSLKDGRVVMADHLRSAGSNAFLIYGEVEPAVAGLVENLVSGRSLDSVPNLLQPSHDWQRTNPPEKTDLALIQSQPYQYLDQLLAHGLHTYHVETSRGCYFGGCTFCTDTKLWGRGWRGYPIENVISLFTDMRAKGVDYAFIFDKDFWGNDLERAQNMAQALIRAGNPIPYLVALRADEIISGEHLLDSFKQSGLAFVFIGAETFSESVNGRYNKGVSITETLQAIETLRRHKLDFGLGNIIDPLGSLEELQESLDIIKARRLWGNISSPFNAMEIRSGTGYEVLARRAGLLGERNEDNLVYSYEFADPRVAKAVAVAREWLGEVSHVNVFLLIAKRMTHRVAGRDQSEYPKYFRHREALQKIDFDFFHSLVRLIKEGRESEVPKLKAEYKQRYERAKRALVANLNPNNPLSQRLLQIIGE